MSYPTNPSGLVRATSHITVPQDPAEDRYAIQSLRGTLTPVSTATGKQSASHSQTMEGYTWVVERMEDRSAAFQGLSNGAKLEPAPTGQHVFFRIQTMTDDTRVVNGAISDAVLDSFFNTVARERRA